jgi:transposase
MSQRTGVINQIRAFLLERGIAIRQGYRALRAELPLALTMTDRLTACMVQDLAGDWRRLDERIEAVSVEIEELAHAGDGAVRLMSEPGIARSSPAPRWRVSARAMSLATAAISLPG